MTWYPCPPCCGEGLPKPTVFCDSCENNEAPQFLRMRMSNIVEGAGGMGWCETANRSWILSLSASPGGAACMWECREVDDDTTQAIWMHRVQTTNAPAGGLEMNRNIILTAQIEPQGGNVFRFTGSYSVNDDLFPIFHNSANFQKDYNGKPPCSSWQNESIPLNSQISDGCDMSGITMNISAVQPWLTECCTIPYCSNVNDLPRRVSVAITDMANRVANPPCLDCEEFNGTYVLDREQDPRDAEGRCWFRAALPAPICGFDTIVLLAQVETWDVYFLGGGLAVAGPHWNDSGHVCTWNNKTFAPAIDDDPQCEWVPATVIVNTVL